MKRKKKNLKEKRDLKRRFVKKKEKDLKKNKKNKFLFFFLGKTNKKFEVKVENFEEQK